VVSHTVQPESASLSQFRDNWTLYRDPVLAGTFAGATLGLVGVFIVLRRAVFVTAAVSQAAGLGVASAFLLAIYTGVELPPVLLAFVFAAFSAVLLAIRPPARLPREATVGFLYLASSALAIIVGDRISQEAHDIAAILFGTAVLVRPADLLLVAGVGTLTLASVIAAARGLAFAGFDGDAARVQGLPVATLETGLWLLVAAEVAVATRALGALPVFAFAVLPALAALRLSRRLPQALVLGAALGAVSGGVGYLAAFMFELPVGAAQATLAALLALLAFVVGRMRS
jgi:zinc transport system permease protein